MGIDHRLHGSLPTAHPALFVLGDSISIGYGPFLEQLLQQTLRGRFTCDRKGRELLDGPAGRSEEKEIGSVALRSNATLPKFSSLPPGQPGVLERLAALDMGLPELNGGDSASVLAYLQQRAAQEPGWSVLLLNCGLHDLKVDPHTGAHQVELETYVRNLEAILPLARALSRQVVWVRTTPVADERHQRLSSGFWRYNADVRAYNEAADEVTQRAGIPRIDLYHFTLGLCRPPDRLEDLLVDHVHFTEPVKRLQAAYIAGWLEAQSYA